MATLPTEGSLILRCSPHKKQKQSLVMKQSIPRKYAKLRSLPIKHCKKRLTLFEKYKNRVADKVKAASQINAEEFKEDLPIHKSSTNHKAKYLHYT